MYRITNKNRKGGHVADLLTAISESSSCLSDEQDLSFTSLNTIVKQLTRSPETLRIMTQNKYGYQGVIDGNDKTIPASRNPLEVDWWDSTFAIACYSDVKSWVKKACEEASVGRTVVMLIPARTCAAWFHEYVLKQASEIQFISGKVTMDGNINGTSDCLAIYNRSRPRVKPKEDPSVAIMSLRTSFTDDDVEVK